MTLADTFRDVMAGVPTPVTVVTTLVGDRPHGTTVSAFTSLSMAPPMLLVALDRRSELLARLAIGQPFGVNVLGADQASAAAAFPRKGTDTFAGVDRTADCGAEVADGPPLTCHARTFGTHLAA